MNTDKNNVITQIKDSTDIECPSVSHVRMEGSMEHPAKDERCLCKQCGAEIIQIAKRKKRIFCSDGCRQKWWNTHMFMVERSPEVTHHFICPTCKKAFTVYGNSKRRKNRLRKKSRFQQDIFLTYSYQSGANFT